MSEGFQSIRLEQDARRVSTLTLNRPIRHNALDPVMIAELTQAAAQVAEDGSRAVILTGAGESFCAGGDLGWMRAQAENSREGRMAEARALAEMLAALDRLPLPLIGRINGQAFGGGIGMMAVCDWCIAIRSARFALTEVRLGIIPATIGPYVLARTGYGRGRRIFFNARGFDAEEAKALDLVAEIAGDHHELDRAVQAWLEPILSAAPGAVARAKHLLKSLEHCPPDERQALTVEALADAWETEEAAEGLHAFFAKTRPSWRAP